jgi:hypothetical protein
MPEYLYENPKTGEVVSVIQGINEDHSHNEDGIEYQRVFTSPNMAVDSDYSSLSERQFVESTRNKKGTLGDLWDASKEASIKREKAYGKDPVREKYFKKYSEKRKGTKHRDDPSR